MNLINPDYYVNSGKDLFDRFEDGLMTDEKIRGFYIGNIFKYVTRYQDKNGIEDLKESSTYLNRLIAFETKGEHADDINWNDGFREFARKVNKISDGDTNDARTN
ncbi:hypothetical protein IWT25_02306 [Secundilactobacillus pentosiphilus]|uniref:DUF3310 domain-containing protein n=1 Tax=Secundilactobacillus pentosiphilus TaxID=1714682 RepID=A0A1Z5IZJ4_9LACO|nr:DUF3310 domain-containing protein [Secundilactobacillus pentosiphilus]GAX06958.1 hypothetical protein IWT25_02306 [Secundilactobacillus pentosiphilus]